MKITIICVGKLKEKYLVMAIDEYLKRLSKFAKVNIVEVSDEKAPQNLSTAYESIVKDKEGERILQAIKPGMFVVGLAINGKALSSEELAEEMSRLAVGGQGHICFIIGGSLGLSQTVIERCDFLLSFSMMTFPHQLMRVFLLEQVYRSFKINNNEPYHK